jgi:fructose-1,6-bisphosphatase/sedoheptulose 1,7-bisphosphatase-like protein
VCHRPAQCHWRAGGRWAGRLPKTLVLYMEKIIVGPCCTGAVDLDAPCFDNLRSVDKRLDRGIEDLAVIVLDGPRHQQLVSEIGATGARMRLIGDGDFSAGISTAVRDTGVHAVMGTGGAPEGVLTAGSSVVLRSIGPRRYRARLTVADFFASVKQEAGTWCPIRELSP